MGAVPFPFVVDQEPQAEFAAAARSRHRAADEVLRDFMRDYVAQRDAAVLLPTVSAGEREARAKAVTFVRASVGLEGFTISAHEEAHAQRYIDGVIDLDSFVSGPVSIR